MAERILIFDTTLRDGEQSPGASLNIQEKLEIAKQLAKLGVDVIEAGFPISSPGDFEAVKLVAKEVKGPIIAGLARATKEDIKRAWDAVKYSQKPRIHVFLATSKIHMKYKLQKAKEEILKLAVEGVKYAKKLTDDVEFSPEDASRTEPKFLHQVVEAVINAGATTVNIPDTVGYATPIEFGNLIRGITQKVPNINQAVISVHCHNDLGLAVANSLSAILNGATQVECTINGIGERAGNASLEEIVMALRTRKDIFNKVTGIKTKEIYKTSRLVSGLTGIPVQPNKAVVGANAFAHEAGIHQHGVLAKRLTYEIMTPQSVDIAETKLVLGKHSGRHAFRKRLEELGYTELSNGDLNKAFTRFKSLADKKKEVFDEDLEAIIEDEVRMIPDTFILEDMVIKSGTRVTPEARIRIKRKGKIVEETATGDGPVDACYKAIDKITKIKCKLVDYALRGVTGGKEALGEVIVKIESKGETITGHGASTDIVEASTKAYINALNRLVYRRR
ncbi:2-isopropylmalate synthase [bacterium]|nr:2-isopropylmalate synthase [bacterium]